MVFGVVNSGLALTVPPGVVTSEVVAAGAAASPLMVPLAVASLLVGGTIPLGGAANTNAEGGNPPMVSASPAFNAYGALTSSTRACSACPEACTPTERACSEVKISAGSPAAVVAPNRAT